MKYLLDTNTVVNYLRKGAASEVTARLTRVPPTDVCICSVVVGELVCGAYHSGLTNQAANLKLIAGLQSQYHSLPFDDGAAEQYGRLRAHLAAAGQPIGPNDLLIAAIAFANGLTLVTNNIKEFSRVPALSLEDWQ